jgi:hypothetical protein
MAFSNALEFWTPNWEFGFLSGKPEVSRNRRAFGFEIAKVTQSDLNLQINLCPSLAAMVTGGNADSPRSTWDHHISVKVSHGRQAQRAVGRVVASWMIQNIVTVCRVLSDRDL